MSQVHQQAALRQLTDRIVEKAPGSTLVSEERATLVSMASSEFSADKKGCVERAEIYRAMSKRRVAASHPQQ